MAISRYVHRCLLVCALLPAFGFAQGPGKVVVKGRRDPSEIVIKGVRDPSPWFRVESQHFVIYADGDTGQVIELANNLERLDHVLRMYLKPFLVAQAEPPKLTLYFQSRLDWPPGLGTFAVETVGIVDSCVSSTQAFTFDQGRMWKSTNASLLKDDPGFTLSAIFTLVTRNFMYRHTDIRGPAWFTLGFGLYFGGVRFTDDQMVVGRAAESTAHALQLVDQGHVPMVFLDYDAVLRKDVPKDFFTHLRRAERGKRGALAQGEFQARAFNLAHYVLSSAENRDKLAHYLELVNDGGDPGVAFADVFGLSGMRLDTAMSYYRRALMKVVKVDFPELPAARVDVSRLSRIEGDFVLDNAVLKACPTPDNGKLLLDRVQRRADAARAVDFAQVTLSRAQIDWGNPRDAIPYLKDAAQRDPYNDEFRYLLGMAYLKLAESAAGDRRELLAAARSSFTEAASMAPETPAIAYALFRAGLMDPETALENTMAHAIDAWRQGHDVIAFARAAALAQAWLGNAAAAFQAFNTLARTEQDPVSAAWAKDWLARLETGVARDDLLAAMRALPFAPPGFRMSFGDAR